MASDFTVIMLVRQHFGNQPGIFNDVEPAVPFVGPTKEYRFDCPNVDPSQTAYLMFQSRDVDHQGNLIKVNGLELFGRIPASPSRDTWNGNILLVEKDAKLKPTGNLLIIRSRNQNSQNGGEIDDFIIDNVVISYKTNSIILADKGGVEGT
jgi:hypothetical protein